MDHLTYLETTVTAILTSAECTTHGKHWWQRARHWWMFRVWNTNTHRFWHSACESAGQHTAGGIAWTATQSQEEDDIHGNNTGSLQQGRSSWWPNCDACSTTDSNQTNNLAECYMLVRCHLDGGRQYNCIQRGSFQHQCTAAGLAIQHGSTWGLSFWKNATTTDRGHVMTRYMKSREQRLNDSTRKQTATYKTRQQASKQTSTNTQHHYGPDSLAAPDLAHLCRVLPLWSEDFCWRHPVHPRQH